MDLAERAVQRQSFEQLITTVESIFDLQLKKGNVTDLTGAFGSVLAGARKLQRERNDIAHAWWYSRPPSSPSEAVRLMRRSKRDQKATELSPAELNALAEQADSLANIAVHWTVNQARPPSKRSKLV
jgi:hypothetical protein